MSWLTPALLFVVAWLAVFAQTQFLPFRDWLGAPPGVGPALVVYAAFSHRLAVVSVLGVTIGLWVDTLSGSRLGVSILPYFLVGFILHARQHLLLRDQRYAQAWLGAAAGVAVPVGTLAVLQLTGSQPYSGWGTLWQLLLSALLNGLLCPACFLLFDHLRETFEYQPVGPGSYRPDREMKRGRH